VRKIILSIAIFSFTLITKAVVVTVEIEGLKSNKGVVRASLFNKEKARYFPSERSKAIALIDSKIAEKKSQFKLKDLKPGIYAIAVYHDKNNDGQLNRSIFGKPKEAYGFSKNPERPRRGPPSFEKAQFELKEDTNTKDLIIYLKK